MFSRIFALAWKIYLNLRIPLYDVKTATISIKNKVVAISISNKVNHFFFIDRTRNKYYIVQN